ncbi:MAG: hypothetical protein ACRDKT_02610 [Actinomycetota bacterium]
MKIRSLLSIALVMSAVAAIAAPAPASAQGKGSKPKVLATDPADDWGTNADPTLAPLGGPLGQELVEASIGMADPKTVNFIIKVAFLPPWGGWPEVSRYNWDFTANGDAYQLTGAFTEYLRGICNPLHTNSCPPPQDPGPQAFFLRQGSCTVGAECHVLGIVQASFDPAAGTITIPVPLKSIKAKPGSKIGPGTSTFGGSIYAAPAAVVSYASAPADTMTITKTYKIPK